MEADTILIEGRWLMFKNELIGKGGYGKVYKGKDTKTGKEVAIKRINTKEVKVKVHDFSLSQAMREMKTMMQCSQSNNPHLLKLLDFKLEVDDSIFMVTELCDGTLDRLMRQKGSFTELEALEICRQIADGLNVVHTELGITHRDLKLDNIFYKDGVFKVADFGLSKYEDTASSTNAGTNFMNIAPETFTKSIKGFPIDVWGLGLIIHELIFKRHPFHKQDAHVMSIPMVSATEPYEIPDEPAISEECKSLLRACLEKDPDQRITIPQILAHPLFPKPEEPKHPASNSEIKSSNLSLLVDMGSMFGTPNRSIAKKVDSMSQPTPEAQALCSKLGRYKLKIPKEILKQFEDLEELGPLEYDDERGGTYLGQCKNGLRHGYGKLVSFELNEV